MALNFKRTIGGVGRKLEQVLLADSQTVEVGDVIETTTTGKGTLGVKQLPLLGVVTSLCDADGLPYKSSNPVAGTASGTDTRSKATSTDGTHYALVDISNQTIYSASVSGTIGTTNDSELPGCRVDINSDGGDYGQVVETSATRTLGTVAHLYCWGVDPDDSTRLLVSIAQSELDSVYE